jgi:uncharacterized ferritin-like protein (DUF455 family)
MFRKKLKQPRWVMVKDMPLIKNKWDEFVSSLNKVDPKDQFKTLVKKNSLELLRLWKFP